MIHLHYYICNVHKQKKQRDPLKPLTITINLAKIICTQLRSERKEATAMKLLIGLGILGIVLIITGVILLLVQ